MSEPVANEADEFYAEVQATGGGCWDTSSLMARFDRHSRPMKDDG